jgi:hypothetical protein
VEVAGYTFLIRSQIWRVIFPHLANKYHLLPRVIAVFVVVIVLCAWFYAWFEDYAAHSPLFQFISAFYHYVTAVPWRAYWSLAPTSSAGINGLMGVLGLVSVPATLIWLRRKQEFLPPRTQRRLSRLWIVLCIAALIFVAPVLTGIFWLISLGIWNLVLLLIHSFFKKT